jgi:hypothetical protein
MTGVAAVVVNNQNSDASLFCPIDDRVREVDEWEGSARDTDTSLPLVEHRRLFQIVRSKAMD